jgi:4-hydroxy-tetrahydrodipicolinate synthase
MMFEGILAVPVTPFTADQSLDLKAYDKLLDSQLAAKVNALVIGGTTGEYYAQTTEERKQVLKAAAERAKGKTMLVAGTNSARPSETIELSRYAKSIGYDAVMLAAPYYSLPTTAELIGHFKSVAGAIGMPILLYNFPARTGVDMNPEFLDAMRAVPEIRGIKESSGSMPRFLEHILERADDLDVISGADDQAFDHLAWGAKGWVAGAANILPREHVALYQAVVRKDLAAAKAIMHQILPLFMLLEGGGKYLQYVKYGCEILGIPVGQVRPPLGPLDDAEKARFRELFGKARGAGLGTGAA